MPLSSTLEAAKIIENRKNSALEAAEKRKNEIYQKLPELKRLDREIRLTGLNLTKKLLLSSQEENRDRILLNQLITEKLRLLSEYNIDKIYDLPFYTCKKCKDTGYITENKVPAVKCNCLLQLEIDYLYSMSNLQKQSGENFRTFNIALFDDTVNESEYGMKISPRKNMTFILNRVNNFISGFEQPDEKNLLFTGATGTGKTFMSGCIARQLLDKGHTVLYKSSPGLFDIISAHRFNAYKDDYYDDSAYRYIYNTELLIIDDLGTEAQNTSRYAELLSILEERNSSREKIRKTILSTNFSLHDLQNYYDERIVSRILGGFEAYFFTGRDLRLEKNRISAAKKK